MQFFSLLHRRKKEKLGVNPVVPSDARMVVLRLRASSAPQQSANGLYRCVELLEAIAVSFGASSSDVESVHSSFVSGNLRASSAPQQEANGAYRCVELLELIAAEAGATSSVISDIHSSFVSGNLRASSAPQQQANGMYRCVELLEVIAYALDD